jgi:hypothetical protein
MKTFYFKNWQECLAETEFRDNLKTAYRYTIIAFLAYLKEHGELATVDNARSFIKAKMMKERPEEWSRKRLRLTRLLFENFRLRHNLEAGREAATFFWKEDVTGHDRRREEWQLDQWSAAMAWYLKWLEACQEVGADHRSLAERLRMAVRSAGSRRGLAPRTKDCYGAWAARYGNFAKTAEAAMSVETATRFLTSLVSDEECAY